MEDEERALVAQIEQAFTNTSYPPEVKITNCKWNCPECTEITEAFHGKHWSSLTDVAALRYNSAALSLFTPEAFRFYLPAYLRAALTDPRTADIILDGLEYHLTPPETEGAEAEAWLSKFGETHMDYFLRRVSGFTPDQKLAIKAYLENSFVHSWINTSQEKLLENQQTLAFWQTFEG